MLTVPRPGSGPHLDAVSGFYDQLCEPTRRVRHGECVDEDLSDFAVGDEWDLADAVDQIIQVTVAPGDAASVIRSCLRDVGESYPCGWLILWWMPVALDVEGLVMTGNTMPASQGWNCVYVAGRDNVLSLVIDAADQGSSCIVVDLEECF